MMNVLINAVILKSSKVCSIMKNKLLEKDGFIEEAIKILIAVVIGALLLAGLYYLFNNIIMPTLNERVTDMFNYAG